MAKLSLLTFLRKLILVIILVCVALGSWLARDRATNWEDSLWVTVYPINGDGTETSSDYIANIGDDTFVDIENFMLDEAQYFDLKLEQPLRIDIGEPVSELPPTRPASHGIFSNVNYTLQLRWWAFRSTRDQPGPTPDIRMFLVYFDPDVREVLPHSLGLPEGLFGIANVFSNERLAGSNNVVIAHEVLHTLGATDKYSGPEHLPQYPEGYAEPDRSPLYPQQFAEIMGGRIPVSEAEAEVPESLEDVLMGALTANEINWIK
ncbi:MAG: hypothetical protein ACR2P6_09315 [Gammaproteobacteria bacterium]